MARGFGGRRPLVRATTRRQRIWTGSVIGLHQITGAAGGGVAGATTMITEANLENLGKPTIARMRGSILVADDQSAAVAEDKAAVFMGVTLIDSRALAAGVGSMPNPAINIEYPWMWFAEAMISVPSTIALEQVATRFQRIEVDGKAMRKAPPDHALVFLVAATSVAGTPDLEIYGCIRVLLLPS